MDMVFEYAVLLCDEHVLYDMVWKEGLDTQAFANVIPRFWKN